MWTDRLKRDDRGVSEIVGFLVIVSLMVILLGWYQSTVVPATIEEAEFTHNERIQNEMVSLSAIVPTAAATDTRRSTVLHLGPRYDARGLVLVPEPPQGRLTTVKVSNPTVAVTITGANASTVAARDTADVWNGSTRRFNTGFIKYHPDYVQYDAAPVTMYEHAIVYNRRESSDSVALLTNQRLISGERISLVFLAGSHDAVGHVERVNFVPQSAPVETVLVRNETRPIEITVPTRLPNSTWTELLTSEYVANGGHIVGQSYTTAGAGANRLTIRLEAGVTYQIALGQVHIGPNDQETPPPSYIVSTRGDHATVREGSQQKIVVQVRDRFDNPVGGVAVNATLSPSVGTVTYPWGNVTGSDGKVSLLYQAPADTSETVTLNVSFGDGTSARERTRVTLFVGGGSTEAAVSSTISFLQSGEVRSATSAGITQYQPDNALGVGHVHSSIDGDGDRDVPFVTSNNRLKIVDGSNNTQTLVASGVASSKTRLGVGSWMGSDTSVFYVNASDSDYIYRATVSSGSTTTYQVTSSESAAAIGGVGDIDGDGSTELVFGNSNSKLLYVDDDGSVVSTTYTSIGRSSGVGIGNPADFDGDGSARVPVVSGGNEILLVSASGGTEKLTNSGPAAKSPIAAVDWDDDDETEIVFLNTNGKLRYLDNVASGGDIKDVLGGSAEADKGAGAA